MTKLNNRIDFWAWFALGFQDLEIKMKVQLIKPGLLGYLEQSKQRVCSYQYRHLKPQRMQRKKEFTASAPRRTFQEDENK